MVHPSYYCKFLDENGSTSLSSRSRKQVEAFTDRKTLNQRSPATHFVDKTRTRECKGNIVCVCVYVVVVVVLVVFGDS